MKEARVRKPEGQQRLFGLSTPVRSAVIPPLSAARWLLVLIVAAGVYFFHGFLVPVLAALVIAFASWPLYRRLLAAVGGNRTVAATLAILFILTFLVVPIALAGAYASNEVREWVGWAIETNRHGAVTPHWIATLPVVGDWLNEQWTRNLGHPGGIGELIQLISGANIGSIYRGVLAAGGSAFGLLLALLFMMIALFFAYRDGEHFAGQVDRLGERILPTRWERISRVVPATISSTVTGMTIIAIGEGVVLGVAYWLAGVPSPVTLGALTGIMALIPGGAPLSFTLVSIYLAASGSPMAGLALFIWGSVELFIVDKTLRPKLVGGPIKLPFLPTFFGLVGGVKTMGFLGLFIGPVLMALLVAIWREWLREVELADELAPAAPAELEGAPPPQIEIVAEKKSQAG
ncbi:MAG: AI-2E family transporter [Mesorhizobium sp.]|uniref:AI-2E family transporter n=4 Tax=Mesorhizobium sp. TaxID=1871066 RepID=UPI000FE8DF4E|nr:AI-2E family transporter [Mesorhizobium sp.]RWM91007.1 MAG: AI-2E family transporter [Mesorhizobium sp.]TIL73088.1 MAG: AI-2E family transporter [Mesorhizobium sp.]TIL88299.1 MAG: AI-2E family transporter [Mesorhizobium sp.]TIL99399.1 MAG: AI-2E family transporter [Mesorhizobium sp.]